MNSHIKQPEMISVSLYVTFYETKDMSSPSMMKVAVVT